MSKTKSEEPEPIVLRVNTIADGKFYMAGSETPFTAETLPEHLRPEIADGSEQFFSHSERLIYDGRPDYGEPPTVFRFLDGQGRGVRRQAAQVASGAQAQLYAEAEVTAANQLSPEVEEALRDAAERHSALGRAELQGRQDALDRLHEELEAESAPVQRFVRRGSVFVSTEKASRFKPGEHVFARRLSGEYESVGIVDSEGQLPPEEITP